MFDARTVFKKLAKAGLLGITRPTAYGGLNLDYGYNVVFIDELGYTIDAAGVNASIQVQVLR